MIKILIKTLVLALFVSNGIAQTQDTLTQKQLDSILNTAEKIAYKKNHTDFYILRKGRIFASWGYNRSTYGRSDIQFKGDNYDFVIRDAKAQDRPSPFDFDTYFNPTKFSIPQYNFRLGYFLTNKLSLSLSVDHMKYVLDNEQIATVDGYIDTARSADWGREYDNKLMLIDKKFVGYEHTDGLNVISVELDYNDLFYESANRKFAIDLVAGLGLGAVIPKTNANLFGKIGNDGFHLAGAGITANVGIKLFFYKNFFLHPTTKVGYLFMPNVKTNAAKTEGASQNISFFQGNITFGYQYKIAHK